MILGVRDICDVFLTSEKLMSIIKFTICKTRVEVYIMLKAQDITDNIKKMFFFFFLIKDWFDDLNFKA